jgi:para-aminobenzoate synthetase/4-amino-4-deoxychorismate lyase
MRVGPRGEVDLLDRHLSRLRDSADHFGFQCDISQLRTAISRCAGPARLRLLLSSSGDFELAAGPLPTANPTLLKLSSVRVCSDNEFLYHKTTNREIYDAAGSDAILVNERGEITETGIFNVAVLRGERWVTPAVRCGLLPGVLRTELLARGEIEEGVIRADELIPGEILRCFNALRGVLESKFGK